MHLHGLRGESVTVTITYQSLHDLLDLDATDISAAQTEALIDQAINKLNLYGRNLDLPNMTGAAGSKTLSVDSREAGAILSVTVALYAERIRQGAQSENVQLGPAGSSSSGPATSENIAKDQAEHLRDIEVSYG